MNLLFLCLFRMTNQADFLMSEDTVEIRDYALRGAESNLAIEKGLAEASWHLSPVPRDEMRKLLVRKDGPAIWDSLIWFGLLIGSGIAMFMLWGTWWFLLPFFVYSVIYGTTSDSRWHEASHGTAFKTDWMNDALYEIASFMVVRESTPWRWSHTRHHSDTIIRGRDPEISVPRPADIRGMIINLFALKSAPPSLRRMVKHASGKIDPDVATYLPKSEYSKVFFKARIYVLIYAVVILTAIGTQSLLPLMYVGFPTLLGSWLMVVYGTTQHAGLAENVLDHRLNCRTVYMNRINRFLYWNMNYHVEHHMYPLVPYHALPKLHELVKNDCPKPYASIFAAYKEIIPALLRQAKDPTYFVERDLPTPTGLNKEGLTHKIVASAKESMGGLVKICLVQDLPEEDVLRFDCDEQTYAVYHTNDGKYYATDGICTHGNTHLADGLVKGNLIECPKHNGRFSVIDGSVQRAPVCAALSSYTVLKKDDFLYLDLNSRGGRGFAEAKRTRRFKVLSNENVATFIKELVLVPLNDEAIDFKPGEYIQLEIPAYEASFEYLQISEPYDRTWKTQNLYHLHVKNETLTRRNYSMASNPGTDKHLKFNVRIALPPPGVDCNSGIGSSYVFGLKPGDEVKVFGPFGDFHIKETSKEMVYIGGGAGMAPLRSHLSFLFETTKTKRKVSYWYGARTMAELYYQKYFNDLAEHHVHFRFEVAFSELQEQQDNVAHTGYIHEVFEEIYLKNHPHPEKIEFYLCGPPAMIEACLKMLRNYKVPEKQIAFDEF